MKTNKIIAIVAVFYLITLVACAPAYIPNVVNTPLLEEEGDAKLNLNIGVSGFDPQLAYAVTDNIGIVLNGSYRDTRDSGTAGYYHKHNFLELGLGYYTKVGENGIASIYAGSGFGHITSSYSGPLITTGIINTSMLRYYIQPSIGIRTDIYEGSFSSRLVGLRLNDINTDRTDYYLEPVITNKVGFKYGKICFQTGLSIPLYNSAILYDYHPFMFSMGLEINIGSIIKDSK